MSNNSIQNFMRTSELYLRFTELKSTSVGITEIDLFVFSKRIALNDLKKTLENQPLT